MSKLLLPIKPNKSEQSFSRKITYQKSKKHLKIKILIGVLFLTVTIGGGIGVAFADSDIIGLLTNWFKQERNESITSIEQAIMSEKDVQKQRLKEELQLEIQASQKKLSDFTEAEKSKRVQEIRDYADRLVANLKIDNTAKEQQIQQQLNAIMEKATLEMDKVGSRANEDNGNNSDSSANQTEDEKTDQPDNSEQQQNPPTNDNQPDSTKADNTDQQPDSSIPSQGMQPL
ncbi:hypothetical protein H5P36_18935 [Bacillus sp. APMAM]|uniref:hypothetical protein n=1 Tax=Margalitia sp. FSL K6-0131 TaxID=2954604 RepID=UPI000F8888AB|nr:hypothetical protein [Bacillus sp. APMAM]RTZ54355.1 hypothetical protein EKO25_18400 [Bacillus sp. SAJ1]